MANFIKKILSGIGILALVLVILVVIADDDTPTQPQQNAGYSDEEDIDEEYYYTLELEDGETADILKPLTIVDDIYNNMDDQRMESLFTSIYNYNYKRDDVYISYIPDAEQSLKQMLKEPYAVGSLFHFDMQIPVASSDIVSGYIDEDDSIDNIDIDLSYIGDEKFELMDDDVISVDVVYAGLDNSSTPVFIALSMDVQ